MTKKGSKIPTLHEFHKMWNSNPNGAGFMFPGTTADGRKALMSTKKLMSFSALKRELQRRKAEFMDDDNVALVDFAVHFRIASAGGTAPHLTHPFAAGGTVGIMHNGHIASLAYDSSTLKELACSPKESKARQQTLGCFRDEEGDLAVVEEPVSTADAQPTGAINGGITDAEYYRWVDSVCLRNKCTYQEGIKIVDSCIRFDQTPTGKKHNRRFKKPKVVETVALTESDTSRLAEILSRLPHGWQRNDVCLYMIAEAFLGSDRVVIFDHEGLAKIIAEKHGTWREGTWFSNMFWNNTVATHVSGKDMVSEPYNYRPHDYLPSAYTRQPITAPRVMDYRSMGAYESQNSSAELTPPAGAPSLPPGQASETVVDEGVTRTLSDVPVDDKYGEEYGGWDH